MDAVATVDGECVRGLRSAVRRATKRRDRRARSVDPDFAFNRAAVGTSRPLGDSMAIVVIVRDEAPYLGEWLHFHRALGIEHVYAYDNDSMDETREILEAHEFVTVTPWPVFVCTKRIQRLAYQHAFAAYGRRHRWMMVIDADEFVFPATTDSLPAAMADFDDLPGVVLPWHMFGSSGHTERPRGLVITNYTERACVPYDTSCVSFRESDPVARFVRGPDVKYIVDPRAAVDPGVHSALPDGQRYTSRCEPWVREGWRPSDDDPIVCNHYFTKSAAEFEAKLRRRTLSVRGEEAVEARGDHAEREANEKRFIANLIECRTIEDTRILRHRAALERDLRRCGVCARFVGTHSEWT